MVDVVGVDGKGGDVQEVDVLEVMPSFHNNWASTRINISYMYHKVPLVTSVWFIIYEHGELCLYHTIKSSASFR